MYSLTQFTQQGSKTSANQDAVFTRAWDLPGGQLALLALADGMGGYEDGQQSASTVLWEVAACCDAVLAGGPPEPLGVLSRELDNALGRADARIKQMSAQKQNESGTTVVLALLYRGQYLVKNVGDSRALLVRPEGVHQLSEDHTLVQEEIRAGRLSPQQAASHPRRHVLSRCIGLGEYLPPYSVMGQTGTGDVVLLCSDGFYRRVSDAELVSTTYQWLGGRQDAYAQLAPVLRGRGETDDVTVAAAAPARQEMPAAQPQADTATQVMRQRKSEGRRKVLGGVLVGLAAAALVALIVLVVLFVRNKSAIDKQLAAGQASMEELDYSAAMDAYDAVLQRDEEHEQALLGLAQAALEAGEWERANSALWRLNSLYSETGDEAGQQAVQEMFARLEAGEKHEAQLEKMGVMADRRSGLWGHIGGSNAGVKAELGTVCDAFLSGEYPCVAYAPESGGAVVFVLMPGAEWTAEDVMLGDGVANPFPDDMVVVNVLISGPEALMALLCPEAPDLSYETMNRFFEQEPALETSYEYKGVYFAAYEHEGLLFTAKYTLEDEVYTLGEVQVSKAQSPFFYTPEG